MKQLMRFQECLMKGQAKKLVHSNEKIIICLSDKVCEFRRKYGAEPFCIQPIQEEIMRENNGKKK